MKNSLKKSERLKKRDDINRLFAEGKTEFSHPFKLYHLLLDEPQSSSLLFGVSVPKKKFKKAVDRNLIKRRIKEAYRLSNQPLKESLRKQGKTLCLMPIYVADEILDYKQIEGKIILLLQRLLRIYEQDNQ
jgi:ribonuclease P protein component